MNGKVSKRLQDEAETDKVGFGRRATAIYKRKLKSDYKKSRSAKIILPQYSKKELRSLEAQLNGLGATDEQKQEAAGVTSRQQVYNILKGRSNNPKAVTELILLKNRLSSQKIAV